MNDKEPIRYEDLKPGLDALKATALPKPPQFKGFSVNVATDLEAHAIEAHKTLLKHYEDIHHRLVIQILKQFGEGERAFAIPKPIPSSVGGWVEEQNQPTTIYYVDTLEELRAAVAHGMVAFDHTVGVVMPDKFCIRCVDNTHLKRELTVGKLYDWDGFFNEQQILIVSDYGQSMRVSPKHFGLDWA